MKSKNFKSMKKLFFIAALIALVTSCAPTSSGGNGGELVGVRAMAWGEPTPYGMVLVERGSFTVGCSEEDSIWGTPKNDKPISVESFTDDRVAYPEQKLFIFSIGNFCFIHPERFNRYWFVVFWSPPNRVLF